MISVATVQQANLGFVTNDTAHHFFDISIHYADDEGLSR